MTETLELPHGGRIAYARTAGVGPEILFLPGLRSDMGGTKALFLETLARQSGRAMTRFDYRGHGASSGCFDDHVIGDWLTDAQTVLDRVVAGPALLVGSSMGGWLALHLALRRPERVQGVVGIAAAPDLVTELLEPALTAAQKAELRQAGRVHLPSAYGTPLPITRRLLDEGRSWNLLGRALPITCPVHLLHGRLDPDVPWQLALRVAGCLSSAPVTLEIVEDGDHRLSREPDLRRLAAATERLLGPPPHSPAASSARSPSR
jgi:pimeloyl-ACP methyl ester carboxylesterase